MILGAIDATEIIEWNEGKRGNRSNGYNRIEGKEGMERGILVNREKEKEKMITEGVKGWNRR